MTNSTDCPKTSARCTQSRQALRTACLWEGVSLAALVLIAVPAKYGFGLPQLVQWIGPLHGVCFLWFLTRLLEFQIICRPAWKSAGRLLIAAFVPLGFLWSKRYLA